MAKFERTITGDFDDVLDRLHQGVLDGSSSASYEDGSDYAAGDVRCAVRVYERYSWSGGNRVSMSLTLVGRGRELFLSAITSGPAIEKPGDLAALLTNLSEGDILFVDEIHRLNRSVEEILYPAMEDYALDIIVGKGPSANSIRLDLPKFTLIGATTRAGQLSAPLRDRFGVTLRLELYTAEELSEIVTRSAGILNVDIVPEGAYEIACRSRGTPRIANRMLRRVRDFAQVKADGVITKEVADHALCALEIDHLGLDPIDRRMLRAIIENYGGGPVGLETLAATIGEEAVTLEDVYEPYLMQLGFLTRTPRGRCVTQKAYQHLHLRVPGGLTAPPPEMDQLTL